MPPTSTDQFSLMVSANGSSGNKREGRQIVKGTTMALENVVLSANHNDVEACLVERAANEADIPTSSAAESPSEALFSSVRCRGRQAIKTKGVNDGFEYIIGASSSLIEVLDLVRTVAPTDSTVLIEGETGTGKELIARSIHEHSRRRDHCFVKLNCAAIPLGLLESELFGHERGAFTGAVARKVGRLEAANLGTLFLDEIGDIPLELQPKLLRVLQDGEFERLGSTRTKKVDIRLIAATNRDLDRMIEERQFRSDLYYRLNVFPIRVPPLRERPEDIPLLVRYFSQKYALRMQKRIESIPAAAMRKLARWHWPGNVRELQNLVERAVILTRSSTLAISVPELANSGANLAPVKARNLDEQDRIVRVLNETKGHVGG